MTVRHGGKEQDADGLWIASGGNRESILVMLRCLEIPNPILWPTSYNSAVQLIFRNNTVSWGVTV